MKVCVLQPDYSASAVDYRHYDPARDLAPLLSGHVVRHVALDKRTTHRQLQVLALEGYDIFVNLCEGYPEWDVPGIDVIHALDALGLPYTGPTAALYDPPKPLMKYVAYTVGVATPRHVVVARTEDPVAAVERAGLRYPLFVKPARAGDSLGIDARSCVEDADALAATALRAFEGFPELLVEEYVDGREFTVLVLGDPGGGDRCRALAPIEYAFPEGHRFKSYALKTSELHPEANIPVRDDALRARLRADAEAVFRGFGGVGYARMDFRMGADGVPQFLEVNFTCSVLYPEGSEGSADHILRHDGLGQTGFLEAIIAEGRARHERRRRRYALRGDALAGYGIVATAPIAAGEVVFRGEGRAQRLVTRRHVEMAWTAEQRAVFRRYAYPVSDEVYVLWDEDPAAWAPQNHSCDPNTGWAGLDIVALRAIGAGEELTLDYAELIDGTAEPFECRCGAPGCRGVIRGAPGNSVTARLAAGLKARALAADT